MASAPVVKSRSLAWTFANPAFDDIPDGLRCGLDVDAALRVHVIVMELLWHGQERATIWVLEFPASGRRFNMKKFRPTTTVAAVIAGTIAVLAVASPAKADWNNHQWRYYGYGPWWGWGTPAYYYQPPVVYVPPPVYYAPAPPVYYSPGVSFGVTIR